MTLIELMVVMSLAAGIALLMLNAAKSMDIYPQRSEVMKFAGSIKSAFDRSALTGLRYDIIINLDDESYSLECTEESSVVQRNTDESASDRAFRNRRGEDPFAENKGEKQGDRTRRQVAADEATPSSPNMTTCDDQILRGYQFKRGIDIERIQTARTKDPVDEGIVRIAVFPNGTIEPAVIWLSAGGKMWTFLVHEMNGRVEVLSGEETQLRDFFEVEED